MLPLLIVLLQAAGDPGSVYDGGARQLDVRPPRLEAAVIIDGVLGEPVWRQAGGLPASPHYGPVDSRPAADSTVALVWYAPDASSFGIRAYEAHGSVVRATLADRDNIDADDKVQILLDTYDDHRRALLFAVNPLGVQQDGVRSEGQDAGAAGGGVGIGRFDGIVDLSPDFTTHVDGAPVAGPPPRYLYKGDPQPGGNLRWGLSQNLNATGTVNPDFSQVEADIAQVTVNQRFALFFPEKRPFFLEGLEQFDTPNALIYTRRIAAPIAGTKLTGKIGGTAVAYISAVDDNGIPNGPHPVVNLLRLRRDLGASSTLGLAYTDRIEGSDWNRVVGTDARVIWKKIWFSDAQIVGSWTKDVVGGAARAGALWDVTLYDRTGYAYGNHAELVGISPQFAALSGFVNRVNIVQGRFANRFTRYGKPGALLENATTFILVQPTWRYRDFFDLGSTLEGSINDNLILTFRGGWNVTTYLANDHQRFDPPDYRGHQVDSSGVLRPFVIPHGLYNL